MKLPIIQALWIGDDLTNLEKLCVQSFLDNGHEFHLYTYADIGGIPDGAVVKDGNEILPESEIYTGSRTGYAAFSDYFRYHLLYKKGGWWVDMDTVCVKPFDFVDEYVFFGINKMRYGNAPLKCPAGCEFAKSMSQVKTYSYEVSGPLIYDTIREFGLERFCKPFYVFNPIIGVHHFDGSFPDGVGFFDGTYGLHLGNSRLDKWAKYGAFDKNANFPKASVFEQLKARHKIHPLQNATNITEEQLTDIVESAKIGPQKNQKRRRNKTKITIGIVAFIFGVLFGGIF